MSTDPGSCYIWDLPDMCRPCKLALASSEPRLNPAMCDLTARSPVVNDPPAEPTTPKDGPAEGSAWDDPHRSGM